LFIEGLIKPFWNDEYKTLPFHREPFNCTEDVIRWREQGFTQDFFTGEMCDMRDNLPLWTKDFLTIFKGNHIGVCFYRMTTCNILPHHKDTYSYYRKKFNVTDSSLINRAIIFLEDWQPGHIFEIDNKPINKWIAGQYILWKNDTVHMAANLGTTPRYTAQLTFCDERI
jgi:hypothetical protein